MTGERLYPFEDAKLGIKAAAKAVAKRHIQRYVEAVEAARPMVGPGKRWLDIACGAGYGAVVVKTRAEAAEYVGVDRDEEAITYARRQFGDNTVVFIRRDIQTWNPVATFDAILSVETIEHLPQEYQPQFVSKLLHLLRGTGSVMVLSCPIGDGSQSANPFHLYEPTLQDLESYFGPTLEKLHTERVDGTFGRFTQAYAVAVWP